MSIPLAGQVRDLLDRAAAETDAYAATLVEGLLQAASELGASDLHLQPARRGLELKWRIDGVLHPSGIVPPAKAENVLSRLKVLAGLLTYRSEVPQEGRIANPGGGLEFRVSTFPTLYGERAVVRLLATQETPFDSLEQLGFDRSMLAELQRATGATSGAILVVGPAGSGKTTTAYTLLREILRATGGGRSIATLEDPVEAVIDGVAQSQIHPASGFDLLTALRSLLRQDPEVILVGEIRDAEVAKVAYQAAMTGQLVITTFHATDAADALARLLDMGIPPYIVRGATRLTIAQRLLRRSCRGCHAAASESRTEPQEHGAAKPGSPSDPMFPTPMNLRAAAGHPSTTCPTCRGTGYHGRIPAVERIDLQGGPIGAAVLRRADASELRRLLAESGRDSLLQQARVLVEQRLTTKAELVRVFGLEAVSQDHHVA